MSESLKMKSLSMGVTTAKMITEVEATWYTFFISNKKERVFLLIN
ncbi:hypothetical protein [Domibacillus sp. A3M-37]|nr:hypothetical protein [Domibacillus sp. A3M-37]